MTEEQGINVIDRCLNSLKERFLISQNSFTVKVITKAGIKVIRAPEIPKGGAWFWTSIFIKFISFSLFLMENLKNFKKDVKWYF